LGTLLERDHGELAKLTDTIEIDGTNFGGGAQGWHSRHERVRFWIPCMRERMLLRPVSTGKHLMKSKSIWAYSALSLALGCAGGLVLAADDANPQVEFPSDYRSWIHVKSTMIGPESPQFDSMGGFQHIYANPVAMDGYRTRNFSDGAVITVDWLELEQHKGGGFTEGKRRRVDVMIRDAKRFASTGGWGFQRFGPTGGDARMDVPSAQQCLACHTARAKDGLVLSRLRD